MENADETLDSGSQQPLFSAKEARVAACLMEKELITPDNYPLTIHSLTLACNQKSSRDPVMNLTEGDVGHVVNVLAERDLVRVDYSGRAPRVSHRVNRQLSLDRAQQAVLTVLMLRRPQTLNDIRTRTERMVSFDDVEAVGAVIDELAGRAPPLAVHLPRVPGQREDRYFHLLCGEDALEEAKASAQKSEAIPRGPAATGGGDRLEALEARLEALEAKLEAALARLGKEDGQE
jgi:uncharacterized protein YceH (UPF0502 family)